MAQSPRSPGPGVLAAPCSPVGKPFFGELNVMAFRLLPLLVDDLKRQQDLAEASLLGEEHAVDHAYAVDLDLPDVAPEEVDVRIGATVQPNVLHRYRNAGGVVVGKVVQELLDRPATGRRLVHAPSPSSGAALERRPPVGIVGCVASRHGGQSD